MLVGLFLFVVSRPCRNSLCFCSAQTVWFKRMAARLGISFGGGGEYLRYVVAFRFYIQNEKENE